MRGLGLMRVVGLSVCLGGFLKKLRDFKVGRFFIIKCVV